jgi:predicted nucleotidyltransferase/predicted XRE-type DNA-binding protein
MNDKDFRQSLVDDARAADDLHEQSRHLLVNAVRTGARAGLTQRQIAQAIGRSQPEVSRLLRFQSKTVLGRRLADHRRQILHILGANGMRNIRVFGSVARQEDGPDSDVDLLADVPQDLSLFALARIEQEISQILQTPVDIVPERGLRSNVASRARDEAIPL